MTSKPGYSARLLLASVGCILFSYASVGSAQAPSRFIPNAYVGYIHDSNLFRLSGDDDADEILDGRDKAVGALQFGAGLDIGVPMSLQYLELNLNAIRNEYDGYEDLDHTVILARGRWGWTWGKLWSGDMRLRYREDIAPFEEFERPIRDERTLWDIWVSGTRKLQPRWVLDLAAGYNELDHGFEPRRALNRGVAVASAEVAWLGAETSESRLGLRSENRRVSYETSAIVAGTPVDNSHNEYELSTTLLWEVTPRSTWSGHAGYALLRHDEFTGRDFSGAVARIGYRYDLTERTGFEAAAWRDLNVRANTSASYVKETGIALRPFCLYSDRLTFEAVLSLEDRQFAGDPALGVGPLETRKDDAILAELSILYIPYDHTRLELTYTMEDLDSNRREREYRYHAIAGNVQIFF